MSKYTPLAWAFGIVGVVGASFYYDVNQTNKRTEVEIIKARPQYDLIVQDLNGNGIPEKFYKINEKKYFLEVDGKNLEDTLRE